ncbi:MAG: 50S ribosomal protein L29 [Desertifilum sp. SIO1I2]|nr:50S ribosomal protein L29 [Desertifilum sp. SIO1I2]
MALPKIADARNLSDEELSEKILATKKQLFDLRMRQRTGQLENKTHQFKHTRHELAQLLTVEGERQAANGASSQSVAAEE